jgi:hypothetical protein
MNNIYLTHGLVALVDDEDYERVNRNKWYASISYENKYYAKRKAWIPSNEKITKQGKYIKKGSYKNIAMHRFILNAPDGLEVDHINGKTLDNRKENLRICTHAQNTLNIRTRISNKSGYKGVSWDAQTNKWRASITHKGRFYDLGRFADIDKAVEVRLNRAKELFGDFA